MTLHRADVLAHHRADVGIRRHRRAALELTIFLRELVRRGDEGVRQLAAHDGLDARLVRRVHVAVEQHDGDRVDTLGLEPSAHLEHARLVERHVHRAFGRQALAHLVAPRARHERHVLVEVEVVGVRAVDAADLVHVAKALAGDERGLGATTLEKRIDGDGRAVQEERGIGEAHLRLVHALRDTVDEPRRRRERLA